MHNRRASRLEARRRRRAALRTFAAAMVGTLVPQISTASPATVTPAASPPDPMQYVRLNATWVAWGPAGAFVCWQAPSTPEAGACFRRIDTGNFAGFVSPADWQLQLQASNAIAFRRTGNDPPSGLGGADLGPDGVEFDPDGDPTTPPDDLAWLEPGSLVLVDPPADTWAEGAAWHSFGPADCRRFGGAQQLLPRFVGGDGAFAFDRVTCPPPNLCHGPLTGDRMRRAGGERRRPRGLGLDVRLDISAQRSSARSIAALRTDPTAPARSSREHERTLMLGLRVAFDPRARARWQRELARERVEARGWLPAPAQKPRPRRSAGPSSFEARARAAMAQAACGRVAHHEGTDR